MADSAKEDISRSWAAIPAQAGVARKAAQRRLAEFGGLFVFVECQELTVGLDGRIGRRLAAKSFETRRSLKLFGLFVNIGLEHIVPRAGRALVDDSLASQRNDRNEHDHEPEPGVVRRQVSHAPARLARGRSHGKVLLAVIVRTDSIDSGRHVSGFRFEG